MTALPLTVVTGFLGSGKTTLIRRLLARAEFAATAVIVNEFGDVGLDHELIESGDEDLVELGTGCLCCAMRGDLGAAVARLFARRAAGARFDRVLLETTGLADPAPILQSLLVDPALRARVDLQRVVVTVDAMNGDATLDAHPVSRKQAALADLLLLTKSDLAPGAVQRLARRLRGLNRDADILGSVRGDVDAAVLFGARGARPARVPVRGLDRDAAIPGSVHGDLDAAVVSGARGARPVTVPVPGLDRDTAIPGSVHGDVDAAVVSGARGARHATVPEPAPEAHAHAHDDISSVSLEREAALHAVSLTLFLQALAEICGPDLLRVKGIVALAQHPDGAAVVHGVQHVFHPIEWLQGWPAGQRRTRLVLIGRRLRRGWVEALLATIEDEVRTATRQ